MVDAMPAHPEHHHSGCAAIRRQNTEPDVDGTSPLVGSAIVRPTNRRQPAFQYVEKVVPNGQTFRGAAAAATIMMRPSVGCIPNRRPEGFSRKSLRMTAEVET